MACVLDISRLGVFELDCFLNYVFRSKSLVFLVACALQSHLAHANLLGARVI